jgi:1-acyl-sn-glycerol-3-phosphate acyltransferase
MFRLSVVFVKEKIIGAAASILVGILRVAISMLYKNRLNVVNGAVWGAIKEKPVLLIANHTSHLDFMILLYLLQRDYHRNISFLAKKELWDRFLWRLLMRYGKSIKVDRSKFTLDAFRAMKHVIDDKGVLGIFPEGTRSKTRFMGPIKPGLEFIIRKYPNVTCVPCGLQGFHEAWPKDKSLTWPLPAGHVLQVSFGCPRTLAQSGAVSAAEFTAQLIKELAELSNQNKLPPCAETGTSSGFAHKEQNVPCQN